MRIDLFLWYSRIYKSRTISSNACKKGHVKINSKSVKPSHDIFIGTIFTVKKNQILNKFKILDLPNSRVGAKILNLYLMDITPKSENEKKEIFGPSGNEAKKMSKKNPTALKYLNGPECDLSS